MLWNELSSSDCNLLLWKKFTSSRKNFCPVTRISFMLHEFPSCYKTFLPVTWMSFQWSSSLLCLPVHFMKIVMLKHWLLVKFPVRFYIFPAGNTRAPAGKITPCLFPSLYIYKQSCSLSLYNYKQTSSLFPQELRARSTRFLIWGLISLYWKHKNQNERMGLFSFIPLFHPL